MHHDSESVMDVTPVKQITDGARALLPLVFSLSAVLRVGLCEPLPRIRLIADETEPLQTFSGAAPAGGDTAGTIRTHPAKK